MKKIGLKFLIILVVVYGFGQWTGVVDVRSAFGVVAFSLVLSLVNLTVKPILMIISLPVTILTVGIFGMLINIWMVMLADAFVSGIQIEGFFNSLVIAVTFSLLNGIFVYNKK